MQCRRFASSCVLALASVLFLLVLPVWSYPVPATCTIGVIFPLSGDQWINGQRAKTVIEMMINDYQSSVALPGLPVNALGCTLKVVYKDSQGLPLVGMERLWELKNEYPDLIGVIGDINDNVTLPITSLASALGVMSISPGASAASVSDAHEFPYFGRTALNQEMFAGLWVDYAKISNWYHMAVLSADDDRNMGFLDIFERLTSTTTVTDKETNVTSNPFSLTTVVLPSRLSDVTLSVIDQALDQLAKTENRIFMLNGDEIAETVLRMAYAKGLMGVGSDGIVRQWIGGFCTVEIAQAFQDTPEVLSGTYCLNDPNPLVGNDRATNAASLAFQQRLQTYDPVNYPTTRPISYRTTRTVNALLAMIGCAAATFNDPTVDNSATSLYSKLGGVVITQIDGTTATFSQSGDILLNPEYVNWDVNRRKYIATASANVVGVANVFDTVTSSYKLQNIVVNPINSPVFANGLSAFPKDRARIYVEYDDLPLTLDGKILVLTYVVSVLGAWTALILLEQALSFWSRGVWKQALGWVGLASLAFGSCSVWPNAIMTFTAITLDVDARLWFTLGPLIGTAFYPMAGVFMAFALSLTSVLGGLKPAPNVNVNEVSEVSHSSTASQSNGSRNSVSRLTLMKNKVTKKVAKLRDFIVETAQLSTWRLPLAACILAILMVSEVFIVGHGFYWKVHYTNNLGPLIGAVILSAFLNLISLTMYFHVTRSVLRYASPFLLAITTMGQLLIILEGSKFTYATTVDITRSAVSSYVPADGTLAAEVAVVSAAVCVLLMAFNVNRLRLSRNVLDKVLNQVAGQLRGLEADIEYEKSMKGALGEQAAYFRRMMEVINLCRPIWRPYAVAVALTDPDENAAEKAEAIKQQTVLPNVDKEAAGRRLKPADKKKGSASGKPEEASQSNKEEASKGAASKGSMATPGVGGVTSAAAGGEVSQSKDLEAKPDLGSVTNAPSDKKSKGVTINVAPAPSASGSTIGAASSGASATVDASPAASATAQKAVVDDWSRVHAHKKEKQLAAILRELSDLGNLDAPVPSKVLQDIRLPQILSQPSTLELMKDVLAKNLSPENISLWIDIQRYRALQNDNIRKAVADEIFQTFIANGAKFEVNLSSFMRDYVASQINKNKITIDLFDEVEKEIYRLMVTNNVDALVNSPMFKLSALLLMHPQYKLKNVSLVNNSRGEIGGNEESTIGLALASNTTGLGILSGSTPARGTPVPSTPNTPNAGARTAPINPRAVNTMMNPGRPSVSQAASSPASKVNNFTPK